MRAAVLRYRVMAYITGVVLIILCFVGIPLQVFAQQPRRGQLRGHPARDPVPDLPHLRVPADPPGCGWPSARPCWSCWPAPSRCSRSWSSAGSAHKYIDPALAAADQRGRTRPGHRATAVPVTRSPVGQQYFTEHPGAAHRPGRVHVVLGDLHFECATDAGVFSAGRLDPGTRVLLDTVPPPPADGRPARPGHRLRPARAGAWRPGRPAPRSGRWTSTRGPWSCARATRRRAGLGNVRCVPPGRPGAARASSPPSGPTPRSGSARTPCTRCSPRWLARLAPGGRGLPGGAAQPGRGLAAALAGGQGWPARRVAARAGYRVLAVTAAR